MNYQKTTLNKKNIRNFAKERNYLLSNAVSKWVFFVDTDEKPSKEMEANLTELKDNSKFQSYYVKRRNFFLKEFVGKDKIIRLVKKGSGKWVRAVHEVFVTDKKVGLLRGYLLHFTADNLRDYIKKINFYSDLHSIENKKEGKSSNIFKIVFFPIFKFFETYLESRHVVFSIMQSFHSFLSWSKQYLEEKN